MDAHFLTHAFDLHLKLIAMALVFTLCSAGCLFVLLSLESYIRSSQKEWHFGRTKKKLTTRG